MRKWTTHFSELNNWVKLILGFCALGVLSNTILLARDIASGGVLFRLHAGFLLLYTAQVIFILVPERMVCVLTVLQGVLALLLNADFTFMPLVRILWRCLFLMQIDMPLEYAQAYRYLVVSSAFTLQMLSAFALFTLLPKNKSKSRVPSSL